MKTKDRIIDAAQELFFLQGIKRITVDDIASHLGMSKKTLYENFKEKDVIVRQLTKRYLHERELIFNQITDNSKNAVHDMLQMMDLLYVTFRSINPQVFYDMQKYHPEAWKDFRKFKEEFVMDHVERNLQRGIKQKLYRSDLNTKVLCRLRMEQVEMGLNPLLFPPTKFDITAVQLSLLDHFLHGICTLEGLALIKEYRYNSQNQ